MEEESSVGSGNYSAKERKEGESAEEEIWGWSWGAGTDGQLGTGSFRDEHLPQPLRFSPALSISHLACGGAHSIALSCDGRVFSWGRNDYGQLGHGDFNKLARPTLLKFCESFKIKHVSAGWNHSAFVTDMGCLFTCGDGSFGQLGNGDIQPCSVPSEVAFSSSEHVEVQEIACGLRHTLVLVNDNGQLYIWGRAFIGKINYPHPRPVPSSSKFSQVALGWHHAVVLSDSEVYMIGNYRHAQHSGSTSANVVQDQSFLSAFTTETNENSPLPSLEKVEGIKGEKIVQIASGAEHSALLTDKGCVMTWGWGEHGQLGLGSTCDQVLPQMVNLEASSLAPVRLAVYCGSGFTVVTKHQ